MFADRRRGLMIVALIVVLGGVVWTNFGGNNAATPAAVSDRARRPATQAAEPLPVAESVRLGALPQERGEPESASRNPFRFERKSTAAAKPVESAPVFTPPVSPTTPLAPTGPAAPAPIPLKFIGVVAKESGVTWAVLSLGDNRAPLFGKEGDTIDGRYRILKIGVETIDMVYLDGRGKQTIKLTGQ